MNELLYPIKFEPILKERIWGGTKLKTYFGKSSKLEKVGESWEISDVKGDTSVVSNGPLQGTTLKELLTKYKGGLIGLQNYKIFNDQFPLLIKFIDAKEDLSIQLHPNDQLAKERHNSFGKTEMWYVVQADENANLIVGFNQKVTPGVYLENLENKTLPAILNTEKVKAGDTFFIEVGRIHAIGAGVMVAEIQQTSDITYRVYDWDRLDDHGNSRELHNDLAIDAINYDMPDNFKISYEKTVNQTNEMVECPYFKTNFIHLTDTLIKHNSKDSFLIYMCVEGEAEIQTQDYKETIKLGETVLLPAAVEHFKILAKNAKLLEVYV
ncbi:class I mannose-6-phosphate isomerase [Mangrovimonas sp. AS39]|uniref:type I phosphomannose isomerase catalytic subunit n=1 Tax=Mangrovimonas futianensis TaxID=2895523 RepID=UPI001E54B4BF|nr:type I phosphomannose isomerase catalytic subunit [Mangrovimonas futianensis]MCF1191359.1 class I mannose-6-phosphate isomerase [Mangrovimonas futianensis]MCF1195054.1 class I mannose-6-phosphate isomerase [Mangrovimonas futianensis]